MEFIAPKRPPFLNVFKFITVANLSQYASLIFRAWVEVRFLFEDCILPVVADSMVLMRFCVIQAFCEMLGPQLFLNLHLIGNSERHESPYQARVEGFEQNS